MYRMSSISAVIPVMNERSNISAILGRLALMPENCRPAEVIFVDGQSTDGTLEEIEKERPLYSFSVRVVMQTEKDGLVGAELLGAREATSDYVVILDGDMQHPPEIIKDMWENAANADIIVASRYAEGGTAYRAPFRGVISRGAVTLAHILIPASRKVMDPISGFFMARKYLLDHVEFMKGGYETLLFVLAENPGASTAEVPYRFTERKSGESKIVDRTGKFLVNFIRQSFYCRKASANTALFTEKVPSPQTIK